LYSWPQASILVLSTPIRGDHADIKLQAPVRTIEADHVLIIEYEPRLRSIKGQRKRSSVPIDPILVGHNQTISEIYRRIEGQQKSICAQ